MKKLLFITLTFSIFINFSLLAQEKEIKTYKNFVGGSFYISSGKGGSETYLPDFEYLGYNTLNYAYFQIKPVIGYQINENTLLGVRPIYTVANRKGNDFNPSQTTPNVKQNIEQYGLGIFGRFMIITKNKISIGVEIDMSLSKTKNLITYGNRVTNTESDLSSSQTKAEIRPVLSCHVTPRFRLLGYLGSISYIKKNYTVSTDRNSLNFSTDFGIKYISLGGEFLF